MQHRLSLSPFSRAQRVLACGALVAVTYATFPVTLAGLAINVASGATAALVMWTFPDRRLRVSQLLGPALFGRNLSSLNTFMNPAGGRVYSDDDGALAMVSAHQSQAQYAVATRLVDPIVTYIVLCVLFHLLGHALMNGSPEQQQKDEDKQVIERTTLLGESGCVVVRE